MQQRIAPTAVRPSTLDDFAVPAFRWRRSTDGPSAFRTVKSGR